jgi:hypothetical protein
MAANAAIEAIMDELGWTTEAILRRLGELAGAKKTLIATKDGEITDSLRVPDNPVRKAAVDTMLQLRRAFPSTRIEVGGSIRVEQLTAIALQLESVPLERLVEIVDADDATLMLTEAPDAQEREADLPGLRGRSDPVPEPADVPAVPRRAGD